MLVVGVGNSGAEIARPHSSSFLPLLFRFIGSLPSRCSLYNSGGGSAGTTWMSASAPTSPVPEASLGASRSLRTVAAHARSTATAAGVEALRDGRGVQRATVVGEPRPAVHHGGRVERGDGVPVGHRDCCPSGLSLPALQHMGWRVLALLKGHLHPKAAEVDSRITNSGRLPVDQRDATVALPQHVAAPDVAVQEHRRGRGHAVRPDPLVGLL